MRVYELSAQNRIVSVSRNWDTAAMADGGEAAVAQSVMGRPIWDFVAGLDTRSYLNALFFAVRRTERQITVPYRCDGLTERRRFQMQIEPLEEGGMRLTHAPVEIRPRTRPAVPPTQREARCCGQCLHWQNGATWEDSDHFHGFCSEAVDFVVCPACRSQAQTAIAQVLSPFGHRMRGAETSIQTSVSC